MIIERISALLTISLPNKLCKFRKVFSKLIHWGFFPDKEPYFNSTNVGALKKRQMMSARQVDNKSI